MASAKSGIPLNPTWDDHVAPLFSRPFWTAMDYNPEEVGAHWVSQMKDYSPPCPRHVHLDLSSLELVQANVVIIYQHLRSRSMPIMKNPIPLGRTKRWRHFVYRQIKAFDDRPRIHGLNSTF
ncbi:hypothetical protein ETB97_008941 [Aspergillus alliaceus]|uniref:Uncharacterized protein n=1 Tax=Petromyces alliaceus TaxID=209559 RepID=A0A8H6ACZ2_PETAA|nr:hypothetical protein ETB97_008941 [Aspergillus burnettii]